MNSFFDWYYSLIHLKHLCLKVLKGIFEQGQRFWCKDVMTVTTHACKLGSMTPSNFANFSNTAQIKSPIWTSLKGLFFPRSPINLANFWKKIPTSNFVFENHRKSLIQNCERSELRLQTKSSLMRHFVLFSNTVLCFQ